MSNEIRELAVRLAVESGIADVYRDGLVPLVYPFFSDVDISNEVEALVRSAMREAYGRAADKCSGAADAYYESGDDDNGNAAEALSIALRAEAEKINAERVK